MKISRDQVVENRKRILDAAAKMIRERGLEGVTVAEIMKDAGLTHGAFYGHFKSKDDLIVQAFSHVLPAAGEGMHAADAPQALKDYTALYLSTEHRDDIGCACLFSTLGTEVARSSDETRSTLTASIRRHIETFTLTAPGRTKAERRRAAIGSWSAMIGAVVLARIANEADLSDELLASTEAWINS